MDVAGSALLTAPGVDGSIPKDEQGGIGARYDLKLLRYVTLLALVGAAVPSQAALLFLWPKDNGIVRESVNVAIDAKSVPQDCYVSFYLNNTFMVAVGGPATISGGRKAYTWAWDTREPINLGAINDEPKRRWWTRRP